MVPSCMSTWVYSCIRSNFLFEDKYGTLHMVHGNMDVHMYSKTMMIRILWGTIGMYELFDASRLILRRCPCLTSVCCNIVRIALTRIHVTMSW